MKNTISFIAFSILYSTFTFAQRVDSSLVFHLIDSLNTIQGQFTDSEKHDSALVYINKALAVADQSLGKDHIQSAYLLHAKGFILLQLRQFEESESCFKASLRIKEKRIGTHNRSYCITLNNLGNVYLTNREIPLAEPYFLKAKACFEQAGDTLAIFYGHTLNNLGTVYRESGRLHLAEKTLLKAIKVKETVPDLSAIDVVFLAKTYYLLSDVYAQLGDYPRMEKAKSQECWWLLQESRETEIHYFWRRNNLGTSYMDLGDMEKAAQYYKEAVDGKKLLLGPKDPDVAMSLLNLGNVLCILDRHEEADKYLLEAYSIYALDSLKYALDQGWVLNNLGLTSIVLGNFSQARSYTQRALQKKAQTIGTDNPDWNGTFINLMVIDIKEGNYEIAERALLDRLSYYKQHLPEFKKAKTECLSTLTDMYAKQQQVMKAKTCLEELLDDDKTTVENISQFNIPSSISTYLQKTGKTIDRYLSLPFISSLTDTSFTNKCYNLALYYKGYLLGAMEAHRKSMQNAAGFADLTDAIRYIEYQLNEQYAKSPVDRDRVERLEAEKKTAESNFALSLPSQIPFQQNVTWKHVHAALDKGEAAIEFLKFNLNKTGSTDSFMYVALLLRPENDSPQYIPLFEEKEILNLFKHQTGFGRDDTHHLYGEIHSNGTDPNFYTLIWSPLKKWLDGVRVIYYSPGGLLHKINLNALENASGKLISDEYEMVLLGSTREIVIPDPAHDNSYECVLLGAINYEIEPDTIQETREIENESIVSAISDFSSDISLADPALRGGVWNFIPGTKEEIESIYDIIRTKGIQANILEGANASEVNFKLMSSHTGGSKSPWIIHLSTHGYFFPDPKVSHTASHSNSEPVYKIADHPMIRSGLILAGGNYAWKNGHPYKPGMEDGILTAYEISQMDLSNTELVVLSACETGLGDIKGNEGVFGLQRAFKIAGVKNLIMSLWKVPDAATAELMIKFYSNWLEKKMTIREALHGAQKEMREEGWEVYDWAGFVLVE